MTNSTKPVGKGPVSGCPSYTWLGLVENGVVLKDFVGFLEVPSWKNPDNPIRNKNNPFYTQL